MPQKFLEKGKELNLEMLREIARSYETAAVQKENFAKLEKVKQKEKEKVNCLLKKSAAGRFVNFNGPKLYNQEKCFRCRNAGRQPKDINCPRETVNVSKAVKWDIMCDVVKLNLCLINQEFNSKHQSVKQLCDRRKSTGDDSGFLFALNTKDQVDKRKILIGIVEVETLIDLETT